MMISKTMILRTCVNTSMLGKEKTLKNLVIISSIVIIAILLSFDKKPYDIKSYFLETKHLTKIQKPNFSAIQNTTEKKQEFISYALKGIKIANTEICAQQKQLEKLKTAFTKKQKLSKKQRYILDTYLQYYKITPSNDITTDFDYLTLKIGKTPTSFILAQAILESGWGTSRFARGYNNYFGLHCFKAGCGVKAKSSDVYLETFKDFAQSVLGYYYRLNTGSSFKDFRITRFEIRTKKLPESSLLDTLKNYSELGRDEYKNRLISVIEHNNLTKYDTINYCN